MSREGSRSWTLSGGVVRQEPCLESVNLREIVQVELLVGVEGVGFALVEGFLGWPGGRSEQRSFPAAGAPMLCSSVFAKSVIVRPKYSRA